MMDFVSGEIILLVQKMKVLDIWLQEMLKMLMMKKQQKLQEMEVLVMVQKTPLLKRKLETLYPK
ncbi:hypothetical protein M8C21_021626 [Ambrosia artemisiifolia]|uniref:Uncharacterized protein n=1 Tax=Ambrosia artemisiifolia TaxID=4212 RepID=A0AAD5BYJ1_AMBAR|nr:hypothetical protein M8C21_021626 [Ambrosia artemisiifolia]